MEIFHELRAMVFWSLFNKNYIIILEIKDRFNNYAMVREFCFAGKILILKGIGEHVILYYIILYYYVQGRCARLFEKGEKREWSLSTRDPFTLTVNQLSVERLLEKKEKCLHKRPPLYCQPTSTAIGWIPAKKKITTLFVPLFRLLNWGPTLSLSLCTSSSNYWNFEGR